MQHRKDVFNAIEKIKNLMRRKHPRKGKVGVLLNDINRNIFELEGRYLVLFEKGLLHKLKKIFPKHLLFSHHHSVIEFTKTMKLLVDGKEAFGQLLHNIENAKHTILF